jgi:N-acetylneuraminate synthase
MSTETRRDFGNFDGDRLIRNEVVSGAEWVLAGEGFAARKFDGTCCMARDGRLFKRYDVKKGRTIAGRQLGPGHPVFIVAEISCNHRGSLDLARHLVHAAKDAGADAVKFQCYLPSELTMDSDHPTYVMTEGPWAGRRLYDLYTEAATPFEWFHELFALAHNIGLIPFASVFGSESLALMQSLACPAYKIASAEVEDLDLVRMVAETGRPVIFSDGMTKGPARAKMLRVLHDAQNRSEGEMSNALRLRCISEYPATPESYGLGDFIYRDFNGPWGISDHTLGNEVAIAAIALGACMVEKHLMLERDVYASRVIRGDDPRRDDYMPLDAGHSLTPAQFAEYVAAIRRTEAMMQPRNPDASQTSSQWRRRLVFARDIHAGERITNADLRTARCSMGLEPSERSHVIGSAEYDIKAGTPTLLHTDRFFQEAS